MEKTKEESHICEPDNNFFFPACRICGKPLIHLQPKVVTKKS